MQAVEALRAGARHRARDLRHAEQQEANQRQALAGAMEALSPRERCMFEARILSEPAVKLEDLARRYGVSRERVRQIENGALEKVRASACARLASKPAR
jgi:RNA polymerase sigma-32 factor